MPHLEPMAALSDEELARRARRGCAQCFDELMRRFQVPVLHFLRHRGSAVNAEDLLQDTFIRVYENLRRYNPRRRFAPWLFTIARRVSVNGSRKARSHVAELLIDTTDNALSPLDVLVEQDGRQYLWDVVARVLSESEQTAMWLHYVEEMPLVEIAIVLGRSRVAVKTMLFRARRRLLPHLKELELQAVAGTGSAAPVQDAKSWAVSLEAPHA